MQIPKLPIGIQTFSAIRTEGYLYVDKTPEIYRLLTSGQYYLFLRPRRFGKSLTLSTIESIFRGERELFQGLWIEDQWDWQKVHPVLHMSFNSVDYQGMGLNDAIKYALTAQAADHGIVLEAETIKTMFMELIRKLASSDYGNAKVVILIDEYDKPIIDYMKNREQAVAHREILKTFYSVVKDSDPYIEFLLLTGITKFSKVSIFSELNNLTDITLHRNYATLTGYTQEEVESYFGDAIAALADERAKSKDDFLENIRTWYNGYSWDGRTRLYNPIPSRLCPSLAVASSATSGSRRARPHFYWR